MTSALAIVWLSWGLSAASVGGGLHDATQISGARDGEAQRVEPAVEDVPIQAPAPTSDDAEDGDADDGDASEPSGPDGDDADGADAPADADAASDPDATPAADEPAADASTTTQASEVAPDSSPPTTEASIETLASEPSPADEPVPGIPPAERESDDEDGGQNKNKKNKKLEWSIGGRLMAGWEFKYRRPQAEPGAPPADPPSWEQEPFLRQARVKFRLDYGKRKRFALRMSIELADALKPLDVSRVAYLRNGYARVRFHDAARLNVGYFKRPFSRLELRSPGRLPFRGRGLANDRIIEDRNFGDRSVGAMMWGKIDKARLSWYAGGFAPALRTPGVDLVGRLRADPFEWGSVGVSGVYKRVENGIGEMVDVAGANADLRVKIAGLDFVGDLVMAQDYLIPELPWALGLVGYASYDIDLPKKLVLQPVVLAEWADTNIEISQNDAIRAVAGLNLLWRKRMRVMPQVEFIRPRGVIDNPWTNKDTYYVMFSLEL